jgi:hypothetical protein
LDSGFVPVILDGGIEGSRLCKSKIQNPKPKIFQAGSYQKGQAEGRIKNTSSGCREEEVCVAHDLISPGRTG